MKKVKNIIAAVMILAFISAVAVPAWAEEAAQGTIPDGFRLATSDDSSLIIGTDIDMALYIDRSAVPVVYDRAPPSDSFMFRFRKADYSGVYGFLRSYDSTIEISGKFTAANDYSWASIYSDGAWTLADPMIEIPEECRGYLLGDIIESNNFVYIKPIVETFNLVMPDGSSIEFELKGNNETWSQYSEFTTTSDGKVYYNGLVITKNGLSDGTDNVRLDDVVTEGTYYAVGEPLFTIKSGDRVMYTSVYLDQSYTWSEWIEENPTQFSMENDFVYFENKVLVLRNGPIKSTDTVLKTEYILSAEDPSKVTILSQSGESYLHFGTFVNYEWNDIASYCDEITVSGDYVLCSGYVLARLLTTGQVVYCHPDEVPSPSGNYYLTDSCAWVLSSEKKATCVASGNKTYICDICGKTKTELDAALGHDLEDATCKAPKTCKVCGATEGEALEHNYILGICISCGAVGWSDPDNPSDNLGDMVGGVVGDAVDETKDFFDGIGNKVGQAFDSLVSLIFGALFLVLVIRAVPPVINFFSARLGGNKRR